MQEISIYTRNKWNFKFNIDGQETPPTSRTCFYCNSIPLNSTYCYIIDSLKESGFLDENYREICCCCFVLKMFGLEHARNKLIGFLYCEDTDILTIEFYNRRVPYPYFLKEKDLPETITIRIHDFSKVKLFE